MDESRKAAPDRSARESVLMLLGAASTTVGIFVVGTRGGDWAGLLVLAGWIVLGAALHRFGRLGGEA